MSIQVFGIIEFELIIETKAFIHEVILFFRKVEGFEPYVEIFNRQQLPSIDVPTGIEFPEKTIIIGRFQFPKGKGNSNQSRFDQFDHSRFAASSFSEILYEAKRDISLFVNDNMYQEINLIIGLGMDNYEAQKIYERNLLKDTHENPIEYASKLKLKFAPLNQEGVTLLRNFLAKFVKNHENLKEIILPYIRFQLAQSTEFTEPVQDDEFYGLAPPKTKLLHDWLDFREQIKERGGKLTLKRIAEILGMNANTVRKKSKEYENIQIVHGSIQNKN